MSITESDLGETTSVKIERLVAIEEIRQLCYRYAWGWDTGDLDMVLGVFTADAVWDESEAGIEKCTGHAEIRDAFDRLRPLISGGAMHPVTNHMIDFIDDDHATATCYFMGDARTPDGGKASAHGAFEDRYVRREGRWRISSRRARMLLPPETSSLS